jgi:hypothetical protein
MTEYAGNNFRISRSFLGRRGHARLCQASTQGLRVVFWCSLILVCGRLFSSEVPGDAHTLILVAPLYITDEQFASEIVITNTSDSSVHLLARLDSLEGEEVGQKQIALRAKSTVTINVDSIDMTEHRFPTLGTISIATTFSRIDTINAYLAIESRTASEGLHIKENFQAVEQKPRPHQVAFVPPSFSVPVLAVHNLSELPERVSIACSDTEGGSYESQLPLAAHMTFLVNACINGKSESRTYQQLLRGDIGPTKEAMTVHIKIPEGDGGFSAWGFAVAKPARGSKSQVTSIEFVGWNPPIDSTSSNIR